MHVWIVEWYDPDKQQWRPLEDSFALTKTVAERNIAWAIGTYSYELRLRRYERKDQ